MLLLVVIAYYAKEQMFGLSCALCKNLKIKFVWNCKLYMWLSLWGKEEHNISSLTHL